MEIFVCAELMDHLARIMQKSAIEILVFQQTISIMVL